MAHQVDYMAKACVLIVYRKYYSSFSHSGTGKTAQGYGALAELHGYANIMLINSGDLLSQYWGGTQSLIDGGNSCSEKKTSNSYLSRLY
jgi:hypothetical protein